MAQLPSLVILSLLSTALVGCSEKQPTASATATPGRAEAKAEEGSGDSDKAYDETKVTRTGVYIDPQISKACGMAEADAFFPFDSAAVADAGTRNTLDHVAECLSKGALKGREVVLVGHTDPQGSDEYNEKLGQSRAESVVKYLKEHGVERTRMDAESHGETEATGDAASWPRDRRVDIMLGAETKP